MRITRTGNWAKATQMMYSLPTTFKAAAEEVMKEEADRFVEKVKDAFASEGKSNGTKWPPDKESTLMGKESPRSLHNSGALSKSVYAEREGRMRYRIAFREKHDGGVRMSVLARTHEFGAVISQKVTKAQHAAVMAKLGKSGAKTSGTGKFRPGATIIIKIPARSFLRATRKAHFAERDVRRRVANGIRQRMRAMYGGVF